MNMPTFPFQLFSSPGDISRRQERLMPLYILLVVLGILLVILCCVYIVVSNVTREVNTLLERNSIYVRRSGVKIALPQWSEWQIVNYMQR